jgi:hypothetical protein
MAYDDGFYDGIAERTKAVMEKMQMYVDLALDNGDSIYQSKPGVLEITIRVKKEKTDGNV